ncbi:helix-turn-helix transcriptional regulator [uncultured Gemella sp.]|uniref:helix-turn-helix transcriptional regulator n=1 Tax=uncultured Gemella sp. TaxID=254352 RepID=UPI0025EB832A|nr:helix-turn-helix transcriptional regulator [uncultured Gemella sp.]
MEAIKINKVQAYRKALGLKQSELSEILNISVPMYSRKERRGTAFTDKEKVTLLNYFKEYFPNETIDSLFF